MNYKTPILLITTALITFLLTYTCNSPESKTALIKTQIKQIDAGYKKNTINYNHLNDSLVKELESANTKLIASKQTLAKTQNKLLQLSRLTSVITPFDTLKEVTRGYISQVDSTLKDYANKDSIQSGLIQIKDKQIQDCDSSYNQIKELSVVVVNENRKLEKKIRRKETFNKILEIALGVSLVFIGSSVILK